jgi:DNA modification methylase
MTEQMKMDGGKSGGPVECLGMTFPSDDARREHFLKLLAEKLQDPEFRTQEGFPQGSDDSILAMSDPPYYTASPNPWLADFVEHYGKPYDCELRHDQEPFAADVSEGKNNSVYLAHSYHTKVPHRAIMRYLLHYTKPGDVVLDSFCGTGMAGVAAQLCGDRNEIRELGFRIEQDGSIMSLEQNDGKNEWARISSIGARCAILNDLSPAATFIANSFNSQDTLDFEREARSAFRAVEDACGWMFRTLHKPTEAQLDSAIRLLENDTPSSSLLSSGFGQINYTVWSDVFICRECTGEIIFWDAAVNKVNGKVTEPFNCPHCSARVTKRRLDRAWETKFDLELGKQVTQAKFVPVHIDYKVGRSKFSKRPDKYDLALLKKVDGYNTEMLIPAERIAPGDEARRNDDAGITHTHHFFTRRNLLGLTSFKHSHPNLFRCSNLTSTMLVASKLYRFRSQNGSFGAGGGPMSGTLYIPSLIKEIPILKLLKEHIDKMVRMKKSYKWNPSVAISTGSAAALSIKDNSVDYIFIDPPFGSNIQYADLNFLWEAWLGVKTSTRDEAVESKTHNRSVHDYRKLMTNCFSEAYRVLKPGRWITVEFSNTQASVWNAIQTAIQESGFVVANVSALDKKQGSFKAVNTTTAVKQDLVISAYKPNGGLEEKLRMAPGAEDNVWDFVNSHLRYVPSIKMKGGELEFVTERDPRVIFDRMISWFVRHGIPVPLSSQEFQEGLRNRNPERDGMVFLSEQVAEYDRKRARAAQAPQMELFVSDERSAIDWLTDFLRKRPSTYQEVHPDFTTQVGAGWKKHEEKPELSALLDENFLRFDGNGDVPSQIHSYLSTNFKDLRGLEKEDPRLKAKAKDRWFVPDPNKAKDLEQKRERSLLKEFEAYKTATKRQLKESRLEVLRAGFRTAWATKDYKTIIGIAEKLPDETLQEDEKLLLWYDQALTRTEADA